MDATNAAQPDARRFAALVRRRWTVSLALTVAMLAIYYGFIVMLAFRADWLALRLGERLTLGLPVGLGVIFASWLFTGIYVRWANGSHDAAVLHLKNAMQEEGE